MQRLLIALYALWRNIANRFSKSKEENGRVLIIFQQIFGDAVVLSSALPGYVDLFVKQKGWKVKMICLPSVQKFLEQVAPIPKEIEVEAVDFKKLVNDFGYFRNIVKLYNHSAELSVVTGSSMSADLLSAALSIKRRVGMVNVFPRRWPPQMALFYLLAYTESIVPEIGSMMIQRNRKTLQYLGLEGFEGKLPLLLRQHRMIEGDYCVICPGASVPVKRWPAERFANIADYLIESRGWEVHVCGGVDEELDCQKMIAASKHPQKIISHVGKTTFAEWSSIIEYARLVVGNDSATIHIAAGHRVKAVCIAGVYDKYQFFPYKVDCLNDGDFLPNTVLKDMSCEYCRTRGYYAGYKNSICKKAIKGNKCALCIDEITIEEVKQTINRL